MFWPVSDEVLSSIKVSGNTFGSSVEHDCPAENRDDCDCWLISECDEDGNWRRRYVSGR